MDEKLAKLEIMRDVGLKFQKRGEQGFVIPEEVFAVLNEVIKEHGLLD